MIARQVEHRRQQVHQRYIFRHHIPLRPAGHGNDQRHGGGRLVEMPFEPQAALAKEFAMVGGENDHGILAQRQLLKKVHKPPDLMVDIGYSAVIGAPAAHHGVLVEPVIQLVPDHDVAGQRVLLVDRQRRHRRHGDVHPFIQVPKGLRAVIGIVRMGQRDHRHERPVIG